MKKDIKQEISTWKYLATLLDQDHQKSVKEQILIKVKQLKKQYCSKSLDGKHVFVGAPDPFEKPFCKFCYKQ